MAKGIIQYTKDIINDSIIGTKTTYSSKKIEELLNGDKFIKTDNILTEKTIGNTQVLSYTDLVSSINDIKVDQLVYDTNERIVGRWVDGRPLYRKVITLGQEVLPTKNWTSRFSIPDSKELINVVVKSNDNTIRTSGALFRIENEYFQDWQLSEFCVYQTAIVEYTKTTDAPNSFDYGMIMNQFAQEALVDVAVTDAEVDKCFE